MLYVQQGIIVSLVPLVAGMAWAGGPNVGLTPGSRPQVKGKSATSRWRRPVSPAIRDLARIATSMRQGSARTR
jgi:hypothetical protein